jgi:hypothetical protein
MMGGADLSSAPLSFLKVQECKGASGAAGGGNKTGFRPLTQWTLQYNF